MVIEEDRKEWGEDVGGDGDHPEDEHHRKYEEEEVRLNSKLN